MITASAQSRPATLNREEYRIEGRKKVSGSALYAADLQQPGMLWAAFVAGTEPHARIRAVDTAEAREMPGVRAVLTGVDVQCRYLGRALLDWPVLAWDRVHFVGQYVAAVAADTREQAEAAARSILVEYEELPTLFDPEAALEPEATVLHSDRSTYPFLYGKAPVTAHPNIQGRVFVERGDVSAAFANAARVFEHRFTTPRYHGGYLEPHATLVWIDGEDVTHVVSTNKAPGALKGQLCRSFDLSPEKVVIEQNFIGGDFGAKGLSIEEFPCYALAKATGRPVKFVRPYTEDVRSTNTRHASVITIKTGIDSAGNIAAFAAKVIFNGGAYAAAKPIPTLTPGVWTKTPYRLPNAQAEVLTVYTNTIPAGHVRAPGDVQILFALESHIDMVAQELGIDPIDLRARNAIVGDETDMDGLAYIEPRGKDILAILRRQGNWDAPSPVNRAKGIALSVRHIGHGQAQVKLTVMRNGAIELRTPLMDQGAGAVTMLVRTVAGVLGITDDTIAAVQENSSSTIAESGPGASRVTHVTGRAAELAAEAVRSKLEEHGWDGSPETFAESARSACAGEPAFEVVGTFNGVPQRGAPESHNFSGYLADVSVDPDTGALKIHELLHVVDVGTIINPVAHQGQIDGGIVFGLGHALTEELLVEEGRIQNLTFADYKLPTQPDIPPLRTILLPTPGGPGPFGAKMIGESSTAGVAPAIANAIARAIGVRLTTLPMTAERIYEALSASRGGSTKDASAL